MTAASPYVTALAMGLAAPSHIDKKTPLGAVDADRVTAYWTYSDIFHNVESAFTLVMRDDSGDEISRRYVPSARTIIEAANRYLGKSLTWVADPNDIAGSPVPDAAVAEAMAVLKALFAREEFSSKYLSLKRWMLVRGDGLLHVSVDAAKPQGSRLRITELDPSTYFPIYDPVDAERIVGCLLVMVLLDDAGNEIVQRLRYLKMPSGTIAVQMGYFETTGWDDRTDPLALKPVSPPAIVRSDPAAAPLLAGFELPSQITALPVYHFRNNRRGSEAFGTSELQGIETLITGINQTATDEDLAIALVGLGVYTTDSGRPRDDQGRPADWVIQPASVMELEQGAKMERLAGVGSIQPLLDHSAYLAAQARETTGTSDVAVGKVDVQVAQSGIALSIQMAPVLAKNEEKELEISTKLAQLLHDLLNGWLPAFEGYSPAGVIMTADFGNPLPIDRAATLKEIIDMVNAKIISIAFAQTLLNERLGFNIPSDMIAAIASEQGQLLDAMGARLDAAAAPELEPAEVL